MNDLIHDLTVALCLVGGGIIFVLLAITVRLENISDALREHNKLRKQDP